MPVDINFMIGGEAGQGVQSVGSILAKALARGGYHVFADQGYESRVRGGHNFFRVRTSDTEINALSESVDILVALNKESIDLHHKELNDNGAIIYDGDRIKDAGQHEGLFAVPLERLAQDSAKNKLMSNTVALGAALGLTNYDKNIIDGVIEQQFGSGDTGKANVAAANAGYEYARANFKRNFTHNLVPIGDSKRMLLSGNDAIALGALAAGCKFMAAA